jgi:two-component system chemotaxis response regulator CheY
MVFLITEDSRPARNLVKSYIDDLELKNPYLVLEAENGEDTLYTLQTRSVDFIFLEKKKKKKMTGLEVLKEIRKMDRYKDVPVIMVSSESDKFNVVESLKCGANGFVVKPIDKKVFLEKVTSSIKSMKR